MTGRTIEVFTAGCQCCEEVVQTVSDLACENCDVQIRDLRTDAAAQAKARQYGIERVPAVAVNRLLAECCQGGVDAGALRRLGIGSAA